ncbi:hypothetical protein QCA50_000621 [Cerrena zonata]|uniref:Uncharacterized protein n=1 Tax=Cerrena zonata TaxID=2478898 RepID=A0AAW0GTX0_9APHY
MTNVPFSRLQLAAALIEYDNDNLDPSEPRRNAQESAIFAHLRRNIPRAATAARRSTDYLGVSLPSENGSLNGRESVADVRRSRGSIDALRNPFGRDSTYDGHELATEEGNLDVDLSSWGLDAFMPKEKASRKGKAREDPLPNPHPLVSPNVARETESVPAPRRAVGARTMSLGNMDMFGEGDAFLDAKSTIPHRTPDGRRHSIGSPLDLAGVEATGSLSGRPKSSHALIDNIPVTPPLHAVPFPTVPSVRSASPPPADARPGSRASLLNSRVHGRTYSTASFGSKIMLNDVEEENNPFAVRPPSPSVLHVSIPKARARTMSVGSMNTQMLLRDEDMMSTYTRQQPERERRYSRLELMRPKILVMPSPLQSVAPPPRPVASTSRDGFLVTTDGPPLPPGAKSSRKSGLITALEHSEVPIPSNSFTPNPRMSLTLSQLTFRNTLAVDGQRDVAYVDIEDNLRRATEEGQQVNWDPEPEPEPEPEPPTPTGQIYVPDGPIPRGKPAGKLFGKSLIDDIETRKLEMKSKQRVFYGDQRPSMMQRTPMQRASTFIDPESLKQRPISQHLESYQSAPSNLQRRKTLINLEEDIPGAPRGQSLAVNNNISASKSVFGVDTLWERELSKLKEIEAREKVEAEERRKRGELDEETKGKKKRRKGKGKEKEKEVVVDQFLAGSKEETHPTTNTSPPVLPAIQKASTRRLPPPPVGDFDDEESESDSEASIRAPKVEGAEGWVDSDEEREKQQAGPIRTVGSGPRYPQGPPRLGLPFSNGDDSDEDDVPLVATIGKAAERLTRLQMGNDDDSDEEKPLVALLEKTKLKIPSVGGSFGGSLLSETSPRAANGDDEDEDDKPLGLRASHFMGSQIGFGSREEDEDEKPLALHPEQMRRTQYMMAAQQQQQQQQLMMQAAQMRAQSMMYGMPSMMGSGYFGPPMAPPMMVPPVMPGTPPPMHDAAKYGRVDRWRQEVAVEGQPPS